MSSPKEHRLYPIILKQVLWDEEEEKIRKRLAVNEVPDDEAEDILASARRERLQILRERSREQLIMGTVAFLVGMAVFALFRAIIGGMHVGVLAGACVFFLGGGFYLLKGTLGYLRAPRRRGSVTLEE